LQRAHRLGVPYSFQRRHANRPVDLLDGQVLKRVKVPYLTDEGLRVSNGFLKSKIDEILRRVDAAMNDPALLPLWRLREDWGLRKSTTYSIAGRITPSERWGRTADGRIKKILFADREEIFRALGFPKAIRASDKANTREMRAQGRITLREAARLLRCSTSTISTYISRGCSSLPNRGQLDAVSRPRDDRAGVFDADLTWVLREQIQTIRQNRRIGCRAHPYEQDGKKLLPIGIVAKRIGCSTTSIKNWESGRVPSPGGIKIEFFRPTPKGSFMFLDEGTSKLLKVAFVRSRGTYRQARREQARSQPRRRVGFAPGLPAKTPVTDRQKQSSRAIRGTGDRDCVRLAKEAIAVHSALSHKELARETGYEVETIRKWVHPALLKEGYTYSRHSGWQPPSNFCSVKQG
jgi:hypothetical protein